MTIKELKELITQESIPDDAEIYVQADHGQDIESAYFAVVTRDNPVSIGSENTIWEFDDWENDVEDDDDYNKNGEVRAVLITSI